MDIRPQLSQTQSQRLMLSPQMRQFLRLVQLPVLEMRAAIEQELSINPAIEEVPDAQDELDTRAQTDGASTDESDPIRKLEQLERLQEMQGSGGNNLNEYDSEKVRALEKNKSYQESLITKPQSLADYLFEQSRLLNLDDAQIKIATQIIGNIDERGYLAAGTDEIAQALKVDLVQVEQVLSMVQQLDPPGVGARSLQECLCIQLARKELLDSVAYRIVSEHLSELERHKYTQIARALQIPEEEVHGSVKVIATLEPRPGRSFSQREHIAIVPDLRVYRDEITGELRIELTEELFPHLRINPQYRRMIRNAKLDKKTRAYLRERIQAALAFIQAMDQRKSTLLRIGEVLLRIQRDYMEHGPSHLKPLRMKDIAEEIGLHESTISRAIQGKYIITPHSTVALRTFFTSALETDSGESASQTSIVHKIKALIEAENSEQPFSDQHIADLLKKEGIRCARRTVAKYRELARILPTHLRRQHKSG